MGVESNASSLFSTETTTHIGARIKPLGKEKERESTFYGVRTEVIIISFKSHYHWQYIFTKDFQWLTRKQPSRHWRRRFIFTRTSLSPTLKILTYRPIVSPHPLFGRRVKLYTKGGYPLFHARRWNHC